MWWNFHELGDGLYEGFLKALKAFKKGLKVRLFTQISRAFFRTWNFSNPSTEGRDMAIYKRERQKKLLMKILYVKTSFLLPSPASLPPSSLLPLYSIDLLGRPLLLEGQLPFQFDILLDTWWTPAPTNIRDGSILSQHPLLQKCLSFSWS